jgi:hypothetical protein
MKVYHIFSLKHSPWGNEAVWWRPDDDGYTSHIDQAGVYREELINARPEYYNNGTDTIAIPVEEVSLISHRAVDFCKVRNSVLHRIKNAKRQCRKLLLEVR